jgi:hypothetical protein
MNKQLEALRLADLIDHGSDSTQIERETAAELRRLHSVNTELVKALEWIADQTYDPWTNGAEAQRVAQAAIAKAQE